jgi:hypothetical protein
MSFFYLLKNLNKPKKILKSKKLEEKQGFTGFENDQLENICRLEKI